MTIHSFFSDTPIVPLFVLGVIATLFGLWDQSRQPKPLHISAHRVNPELDAKRFYVIAQMMFSMTMKTAMVGLNFLSPLLHFLSYINFARRMYGF